MSDIALLRVERGRLKASLTKLKTFSDSIPITKTVEEIQFRLDKLEDLLKDFKRTDDLLKVNNIESEFDTFEDRYYEIKEKLLKFLTSKRPTETQSPTTVDLNPLNSSVTELVEQQRALLKKIPSPSSSQASSDLIKLPKIDLQPFNGDYKDWPSFKDLFVSSVDKNDNLSPATKLQYLKGVLRGEAASLIKHLKVTDANYTEAWSKLIKRYDKKRQIVTSYIKHFIEQSPCSRESPSKVIYLRRLIDTSDQIIRGIDVLGDDAKGRDPWLVYLLLSKLDADTCKAWAEETANDNFPTFNSLIDFLNIRCDALESCDSGIKKQNTPHLRNLHLTTSSACIKCSQNHQLFKCPSFTSMPISDRRKFVASRALCFNCLGTGHLAQKCHSKNRCHYCQRLHHSVLHDKNTVTEKGEVRQGQSPSNNQSSTHALNPHTQEFQPECHNKQSLNCFTICKSGSFRITLLPTAVIHVLDASGRLQICTLLLDSGSQASFVSEHCVQRLGLQRQAGRVTVHGLSATKTLKTKGKIVLQLQSRVTPYTKLNVQAHILPRLTAPQPGKTFQFNQWHLFKNYDLANPQFHTSQRIDIILGADYFFSVVKGEQKCVSPKLPPLQNTIFGYIIAGQFQSSTESNAVVSCHTCIAEIDTTLKRFWELEEVPSNQHCHTEEEDLCESHFLQSLQVDPVNQRYIVKLPFKDNSPPLGQSLTQAISCLRFLEQKFQQQPTLASEYAKFIKEYQELGHMEPVPRKFLSTNEEHMYLPHHAVVKLSSSTTKVRVVFNGSAKTSNGTTLNQKLLVGPKVQRDLIPVLLSFRSYKIAMVADIEKMYRQVLVDKNHRTYQRIVWRDNPSQPLQHFWLTTVTYGTAAAPFLATRALKQLTVEFKDQFPLAETALLNNFYVDDFLGGAESEREALELHSQLTELLQKRGFILRKWCSNSNEFLSAIKSNLNHNEYYVVDEDSNNRKVLGLRWMPGEDNFTFDVLLPSSATPTKRNILSETSKIFDPLGLIAPVTTSFKILLQRLWLKNYDWDDDCKEVGMNWKALRDKLHHLQEIRLPRYISLTSTDLEIHGFADASELAYAAVVYARVHTEDTTAKMQLIASKTRVSPIKQVSIPRLELCAAVLLTKLMQFVRSTLDISLDRCYAWTDSTVVLAWLSSHPRKWKCFVANRTSYILTNLPRNHWHHVTSTNNPADLASRGLNAEQLVKSALWWEGPHWLRNGGNSYQHKSSEVIPSTDDLTTHMEERTNHLQLFTILTSEHVLCNLFSKFSSLTKIINILSKCFQFIRYCSSKGKDKCTTWVEAVDVNKAYNSCVKWAQAEGFPQELKDLSTKQSLHSSSRLYSITPFLDDNGILRVGGRLENSESNYDVKHPMILPKDHVFADYLIRHLHLKHLHAGVSVLLGIIRQKYWILSCRTKVKSHINKCIVCVRHRAKVTTQLMANLPKHRVNACRPFKIIGVDCAGPLQLLNRRGRGARLTKGYIVIFICFSTRAMHIELASDLTADTFLACLKRFSSRRGLPSIIYSDNGTNFIGAKRILGEIKDFMVSVYRDQNIHSFLVSNSITWKFNPPSSPHFGGLWEAGVKTVKATLFKVIGDAHLTFEEMYTTLTQIEGLLNSRPLVCMHDDASSIDALTPAHFLIGQPIVATPEAPMECHQSNLHERWRLTQKIHQSFWKRWHIEYLTSLQQRPKWQKVEENLEVGDLVAVKEANLPPSKWLLGRVLTVHPGADGLTRVATIQTSASIIKRPCVKLCKLPCNEH